MYLSHPVRRYRDDPEPGVEVGLIVTAAGEDEAALAEVEAALEDVGATVEQRLRFGALRIRVDQAAVAELCDLDGIEAIETAATRELAGGDAGEDL